MDLEEVWRLREEVVYPRLFGSSPKDIFVIDAQMLQNVGLTTYDPTWLTHGVIQFAPTRHRDSWLYATSGLSNPWNTDPADYDTTGTSGTGVEFILQTRSQADWALLHLRNVLAFELMLNAGHFPDRGPIFPGDRIPLREPIDGKPGTEVTFLLATEAEGVQDSFELPSGEVTLQGFTGITESEAAYARDGQYHDLLKRLRAIDAHPVTVPDRISVI